MTEENDWVFDPFLGVGTSIIAAIRHGRKGAGTEILPMKNLQIQMSSGVAYYEGELYNVLRQGRGIPAVPLILVGIEP